MSSVGDCTQLSNHRLCVTDRVSGLQFLVDTGANVSVLPCDKRSVNDQWSSRYTLYAANGTEIRTYGERSLTLDLKLRRSFRWNFILCNVKQPILGADFLKYHKLLVDLDGKKLIDKVTDLSVSGIIVNATQACIKTVDDKHPYADLLKQYPNITKPVSFKDDTHHQVFHHIETTGPPVHAKVRPLPPDRYARVKEEFRTMQEMGICRPSKSAWSSPLHVVAKKDGGIRPCGDYRALNKITTPDRYPIPRLQDFTYLLAKKKIFTRLDLNRAYHNIMTSPEDIEKTAICTPFGLFEFTRMTFGLRNAAQTFQRFMENTVLHGLDFQFCYIDDIIIASTTEQQHREHLKQIFERFEKYGITINLGKCTFGQSKLNFLGYEVSTEGIKPLKERVNAIVNFPKPETIEQLRRFLGMLNFYRSHIPNAIKNQSTLNQFLHNSKKRDKTKIPWTDEACEAFSKCKQDLMDAVTLFHPLPDVPIALMTDASNTGVGAVLQQNINGNWKPLGYFAKKFSLAETKYSTYDRELLAVYLAIKHFRNIIEGRNLIVFTDHKPLCYAYNKVGGTNETPRRIRQLAYISEYTTDIRHISGEHNIVADSLSRIETIYCPTVLDFTELAQAQSVDDYVASAKSNINTVVQLKPMSVPTTDKQIYCESSTGNIRPYIPEQWRKLIFDSIHNVSHPGIRTTRKMITEKFFWPGINKDISLWAKSCIKCQKSKIVRHTVSNLGTFDSCDRFEQVHVDIVGPLPISQEGYRYLVTMIDRATGWPEAIPVFDITASTVAKVIYECWISRFGVPVKLSSDQGAQFESDLFSKLMKFLGIDKLRTTPFHPQSNGIIERWHRTLKSALRARLDNSTWIEELPTVLLGLRAAPRSDTGISAAQLTYGTTLRFPSEFYVNSPKRIYDSYEYVQRLRDIINNIRPRPSQQRDNRTIFVHPDLENCQQVFIRNDSMKKSLQYPYDGPFQILKRNNKVFTVQLPTRKVNISIDRLKPAYIIADDDHENDTLKSVNSSKLNETSNKMENNAARIAQAEDKNYSPITYTTRSGRKVNKPVRFELD